MSPSIRRSPRPIPRSARLLTATRDIPVLIVSTKGMETDMAWGMRQGAADYIVKPPREDDLIARINKLVA